LAIAWRCTESGGSLCLAIAGWAAESIGSAGWAGAGWAFESGGSFRLAIAWRAAESGRAWRASRVGAVCGLAVIERAGGSGAKPVCGALRAAASTASTSACFRGAGLAGAGRAAFARGACVAVSGGTGSAGCAICAGLARGTVRLASGGADAARLGAGTAPGSWAVAGGPKTDRLSVSGSF